MWPLGQWLLIYLNKSPFELLVMIHTQLCSLSFWICQYLVLKNWPHTAVLWEMTIYNWLCNCRCLLQHWLLGTSRCQTPSAESKTGRKVHDPTKKIEDMVFQSTALLLRAADGLSRVYRSAQFYVNINFKWAMRSKQVCGTIVHINYTEIILKPFKISTFGCWVQWNYIESSL